MSQSLRALGLGARLLLSTIALTAAACGAGAKTATPSALASAPSTYDGEPVNVSGTAKNPHTRHTRRGQLLLYQLCDASCVNVVQFGSAGVDEGSTVSVTGTFHATFGRVRQISNVVVVGGRRRSQ
ncbi:MAG: hypothetical protein WB615_01650 [Candidatus Tumulicola sp.]